MASIKKRLEMLEAAANALIAQQRKHDPFVMLQPWNMTKDQYNVYYHPEGMYKPPVKYGDLSYAEACALLLQWPGDLRCQISMGCCLEWLFAFHYFTEHSRLYTQEQLDRFRMEDIKRNPELSSLLEAEEGKQLVETLAKLPQSYMVRLGDLQRVITEG